MDKFQNKYKIKSARLSEYDYGAVGYYYVTICTKNKKCHFGRVVGHDVELSKIGEIAKQCWLEIPNHFPHVSLDTFIIMPNHVHGIIVVNRRDAINRVSTNTDGGGVTGQKNPMGKQTLSEIIRWFKGYCTFKIGKSGEHKFSWQSRFYDHVIRDKKSLQNIRRYIASNVEKWLMDEMYAPD